MSVLLCFVFNHGQILATYQAVPRAPLSLPTPTLDPLSIEEGRGPLILYRGRSLLQLHRGPPFNIVNNARCQLPRDQSKCYGTTVLVLAVGTTSLSTAYCPQQGQTPWWWEQRQETGQTAHFLAGARHGHKRQTFLKDPPSRPLHSSTQKSAVHTILF